MSARWRPLVLAAVLLAGSSAGCGKRGNPLAPIRPAPGPVLALTARRIGDEVQLHFTVPNENSDHTAPVALARIEIYATPGPVSVTAPVPMSIPGTPYAVPVNGVAVPIASAPFLLSRVPPVQLFVPQEFVKRKGGKVREAPTTAMEIMTKKYLRGAIDVKPAPKTGPAEGAPPAMATPAPAAEHDTRPEPGAAAAYSEQVAKEREAAAKSAELSVLRYVVIGVTPGKRPGTPSPVLEVPLTTGVAPPSAALVTYDEANVTLSWTPSAPAQTFRVYRLKDDGTEDSQALNQAPLPMPTFSTPVEFDQKRCFNVRAVAVKGQVSVESDPAGPVCLTALDTFPPAAPGGLSTLPTEGRVQLVWNSVSSADLAGYVVLRSEDAGPPAQLTAEPIAETSYTDTALKQGAHYTYTVVAVDKAGNRSAPSEPREEIVR